MTKQELIDKLKELGVYRQWAMNVKNDVKYYMKFNVRIKHLLTESYPFKTLIIRSFPWKFTHEGESFWKEISKK